MSTWQPPWSAQEQVKLTLLPLTPGKQLPRVQATSRAGIDGRAARGLAGGPAPRDLPADLGWSGGCQPGPAADHAQAPVGRAFRATPSQPGPAVSTSTTEEDPAGGNRPDATTARPTGEGYGEAEKSLPCLGGGTIQAWLC